MLDNKISKVYLCRVRGDFSKCCKDGEVTVNNFTYCVSNIDAYYDCSPEKDVPFEFKAKAKEAETRFKFKFYDKVNDMSVIKAFPLTGRTH